jgi:hypothetical protein
VQHFLLLALGRAWQTDPAAGESADPSAATASRERVVEALMRYARHQEVEARKAAVLSLTYMAQHDEAQRAIPLLIERLSDPRETLDVRLSAATALGPLGRAEDQRVVDALRRAMRTEDARDAELVWSSALSLAQLNHPDAADTVLKLLDRDELSQMRYYDRETDPKNPSFRTLNDQEQQRFLINTMLGAQHLDVPAVQQRLSELAESDPSPRVRAAAREILARRR